MVDFDPAKEAINLSKHGVSLARWIDLAEAMRRQFTLVEAVNLDRRQVWISSLLGVQRLAAA